MKKFFLLCISCLIFTSCTSLKVQDYQNEKPELQLDQYLNGTLDAYGIFEDRSGKVVKRFHCVIKASWKDSVGTLDEEFFWSDGKTSKRLWTIHKLPNNKFKGTAADVVGEALGESSGNSFYWSYVLDLEVEGGKRYHVNFKDWMYLMNDKVMINRSFMSKWGFDLGQLSLTFIKR